MKRKFDFSGKRNTSFIRNLKINPLFLFWKKNIIVFIILLIFIFFISIFSATIKYKIKYFNDINHILRSELSFDININNFNTEIKKNTNTIKEILQELKNTLPNTNYSYLQNKITRLESFINTILQFSNNLFLLQKDFKDISSTKKYDIYLK